MLNTLWAAEVRYQECPTRCEACRQRGKEWARLALVSRATLIFSMKVCGLQKLLRVGGDRNATMFWEASKLARLQVAASRF